MQGISLRGLVPFFRLYDPINGRLTDKFSLDISNKCLYNELIEEQNIYSIIIQEGMSYDDYKQNLEPGYI